MVHVRKKAIFHEKYCDSLFLFRCAFPFIFHFIFWKVITIFVRSSWKKHPSRARFRSSDLWVMGPARFHCATLLHMLSSKCNLWFSQNYERFRKVQNKNQIKNIAPLNILSLVLIKTIQVPLFCFLLRFNLLHRIASNKVYNQFTVLHQKTLL